MRFGNTEVDALIASFVPELTKVAAEECGVKEVDVSVRFVPCSACGAAAIVAFVGEDRIGDIPVPKGMWKPVVAVKKKKK